MRAAPYTHDGSAEGRPHASALTVEFPVEALAQRTAELLAECLQTAPTPWRDVHEAADYLRCQTHRIYDLASVGRLRCAKDGRRSLFRREWLDAVLDQDERRWHAADTAPSNPLDERDCELTGGHVNRESL